MRRLWNGGAVRGGYIAVPKSNDDITCGIPGCDPADTEVLTYVGSGGAYVQETSYRFVGDGAGDFDTMTVGGGIRWCVVLGCGGFVVVVVLLLLVLFSPSPTQTTPLALPYDCDAGFARWKDAWSIDQKAWCCDHVHRGCVAPPPPQPPPPPQIRTVSVPVPHPVPVPAPTPAPPNVCQIGGVDSWDEAKRVYCCQHYNNGCPTPAPDPSVYDCTSSTDSWEPAKRAYCCQHHDSGCSTTSHPSPAYDCGAGFGNWVAAWSVAKKVWCCGHAGKGCPVPETGCSTSPAAYDCAAGLASWDHGWSVAKKQWCCEHAGKGCPAGLASA